jgi:hypothetical protein
MNRKANKTSTKTATINAFASKLTQDKADRIRIEAAKGARVAQIVRDFGISSAAVRAVLEFRSYCPSNVVPCVLPLPRQFADEQTRAATKEGRSLAQRLLHMLGVRELAPTPHVEPKTEKSASKRSRKAASRKAV